MQKKDISQTSAIKAKITIVNQNLSSFFIENLLKVLNVDVPVKKQTSANPVNSLDVTNVKLQIENGPTIYGELNVADFLVSQHNKTLSQADVAGGKQLLTLGKDLSFDHWAYYLNAHLKGTVHAFQTDKTNAIKELLKKQLKEISDNLYADLFEEDGKFSGQSGLFLQVLFYSFVQPVQQQNNNDIKKKMPVFRDLHKLPTSEEYKGSEQEKAAPKKIVNQKEVTYCTSDAKIKRVNFHRNLVPNKEQRNILITSALPYVNNVPHLGNIIGCVLSADVFARYTRLMGYNTLYICGTDEYGTATETKALEEKKTPKEICDHYFEIHKRIYEWFDCDFDHFGRTTTKQQTKIAQDIFKRLHENGYTYEEIVDQQFCLKCDRFLADRLVAGTCPLCNFYDAKGDQCDGCGKLLNANELIDPKCKVCASTPEIRQSQHIFIDLAKIQPQHEAWFDKAHLKGQWASNAIQFTNALLKEGLKGRCITRDLKWGTPVPLDEYSNKVFYVWFDAPIGYLSITANYNEENWEKWWLNNDDVQLYQFMGKDNITFHTVIFPCTLVGTHDPYTMLHHIATTEFLNYEIDPLTKKPKKFSKTRQTGVFGDDAIKTGIPSEVWRYYLLINRPESQDTVFLWNDLQAKNNNELLANPGNFSNRLLKFVQSSLNQKIPDYSGEIHADDRKFIEAIYAQFQIYVEQMEHVKIKDALKTVMNFSSLCNVYMQDNKPWDLKKQNNNERCSQVVNTALNALRLLCSLFEPFMPSFSAKVYEQLNHERTVDDETVLGQINGHPERILKLLKAGHQIGAPAPIFREISNEEIERWRKEFGGGNQ